MDHTLDALKAGLNGLRHYKQMNKLNIQQIIEQMEDAIAGVEALQRQEDDQIFQLMLVEYIRWVKDQKEVSDE